MLHLGRRGVRDHEDHIALRLWARADLKVGPYEAVMFVFSLS
jgi:hypothetical protein